MAVLLLAAVAGSFEGKENLLTRCFNSYYLQELALRRSDGPSPAPTITPPFIHFATWSMVAGDFGEHVAMFGQRPNELPQRLAFLLVPNFSMIAFTSAVEVLRMANYVGRAQHYRWSVITPDGEPARASNGITVKPTTTLAEAGMRLQ